MSGQLATIINMSVVSGLTVMGNNVLGPVLPQYALTFSVRWRLSAGRYRPFPLPASAQPSAGVLADRFGRKNVMSFGLILLILSGPMAAMATNYWVLIIARIVQGAGSALYATSAMTWVAQISAGPKRAG